MGYNIELVEMLRKTFDVVGEVHELATGAGLAAGDFPINEPSTNSIWPKVVDLLGKQGKLRALVQRAAQHPSGIQDKPYFDTVYAEMRVQEHLETLVTKSGLLTDELRALYRDSFSNGMTVEEVADAKSMIFTLWGYADRRALLSFMLRIAVKTTNPVAREAIDDWYERDDTPQLLKLRRIDLDTLRQGLERPLRPIHRYLMVVVESPQQGLAGTYFVSLYIGRDGESPENISPRKKVRAQSLEPYLIAQLEEAFLKYAPVDNDSQSEALHTIEFYLPSSLLANAVEPHLWNVSRMRLVGQCMVVIGITERHVARNMAKMIQEKIRVLPTNELKTMIERLKKDSRMYLLSQWTRFWVERWRRLTVAPEKLLDSVVGRVGRDETVSMENLHQRLEREKEWAGLAFTFSPGKLQGVKFDALLDEALGAGMPILLWMHEPGASDAEVHEITSNLLQRHVFDQYQNQKISCAADIVKLVHEVRTRSVDKSLAAHGGEHLTIVLDNPEREIPQLSRAAK